MKTRVLDGCAIAAKRLQALTKRVELLHQSGTRLALATVQVGASKDAELYARSIERLLTKAGIGYVSSVSPEKISEGDLASKIAALNADPNVTGIMVFSPLPAGLHGAKLLNTIDVLKDVEGRRVLLNGGERIVSPTAKAVVALIEESGVEIAGKETVVIGHSDVVGKPVAILLMDRLATVTVCNVKTKNLEAHIENADLVVAAAGKAHLVKGRWIKPGAVVIDVGENILNGRLVGDVEFETAKERAAAISPVPGGVGPLTNVMLIENLVALYELRENGDGNR